jgi:hypothetical protein
VGYVVYLPAAYVSNKINVYKLKARLYIAPCRQ